MSFCEKTCGYKKRGRGCSTLRLGSKYDCSENIIVNKNNMDSGDGMPTANDKLVNNQNVLNKDMVYTRVFIAHLLTRSMPVVYWPEVTKVEL